jgi:hypothetical protein
MTVKELIEELQKLDKELNVYLSDNNLDEETYFYKCLEVKKIKIYSILCALSNFFIDRSVNKIF